MANIKKISDLIGQIQVQGFFFFAFFFLSKVGYYFGDFILYKIKI